MSGSCRGGLMPSGWFSPLAARLGVGGQLVGRWSVRGLWGLWCSVAGLGWVEGVGHIDKPEAVPVSVACGVPSVAAGGEAD